MTTTILDAWLTVIGREGWAEARIDAVADVAATSTAAVAEALPDRWAALTAYVRALDVAALAEAGVDRDGSVRDRLFGMIMARFDAAHAAHAAALAIAAAARRDPALAAAMGLDALRAVGRIADAAGLPTAGATGALRVHALTLVYLAVARVWLKDTSPDLAATMKALDERLGQVETWARRLPHRPLARVSLPVAASRPADDPAAG